jgi:hypothetical protein
MIHVTPETALGIGLFIAVLVLFTAANIAFRIREEKELEGAVELAFYSPSYLILEKNINSCTNLSQMDGVIGMIHLANANNRISKKEFFKLMAMWEFKADLLGYSDHLMEAAI